jgi:hypothetical protein
MDRKGWLISFCSRYPIASRTTQVQVLEAIDRMTFRLLEGMLLMDGQRARSCWAKEAMRVVSCLT